MSPSRNLTPSDDSTTVPGSLEGQADTLESVRAQRVIAESSRVELERRIVDAYAAGGSSLRALADAAGMSHEQVRRLVAAAGDQ